MGDLYLGDSYPFDEAPREALRMERLDEMNRRAYLIGKNWGLSLRCKEGDHRCRNDGSTCLCRCHDRRVKP